MSIGNLTEYRAVLKLMEMGHTVSMPCDGSCKYDLIADTPKGLKRIQVKSCSTFKRGRYRVDIACGMQRAKTPYSVNAFDTYLIYLPNHDLWYVVPLFNVWPLQWLELRPDYPQGKYEPYREAWKFLQSPL